ncbi:hypothetical protein LSAT2_007159 [Lamellibrachia satsuma]|nr:hypothetical protein LSAT2_007159 [Lamellibrachia satsuma]
MLGTTTQCDMSGTTTQCDMSGTTTQCDMSGTTTQCDMPGTITLCDMSGTTTQCKMPGTTTRCDKHNTTTQCDMHGTTTQCDMPGPTPQCDMHGTIIQLDIGNALLHRLRCHQLQWLQRVQNWADRIVDGATTFCYATRDTAVHRTSVVVTSPKLNRCHVPKVSRAMSIVMFLAMIIHESFFAYLSPNSEHVPLFMSYMTTSLVLVGLSLLNTFLLLSAFHGGQVGTNPRLVGWARSAILVGLSRVVCLRSHTKLLIRQAPPWDGAGVPEADNDHLSEKAESKTKLRETLEEQMALGKSHENVSNFELDFGVELAKKKKKHKKKKKKKPAHAIQMLERHLQTFMLHSFNQAEKEHNMDEWKQVAMVIGRALLIIYGVITICMWIILTKNIVSRP